MELPLSTKTIDTATDAVELFEVLAEGGIWLLLQDDVRRRMLGVSAGLFKTNANGLVTLHTSSLCSRSGPAGSWALFRNRFLEHMLQESDPKA